MTTYAFNGFTMLWQDTNGDGNDDKVTLGTTKLKIVAPDNQNSFSYTIIPNTDGYDDVPEVILSGRDAYSFKPGGRNSDDQNSGTSIGEIHWGNGNATQILAFYQNETDHIFVIGGVNLPRFNSKADVDAFEASATYSGEVTSGPVAERR